MAKPQASAPAAPQDLPKSIILNAQFGYYTDDEEPVLLMWQEGQQVTDEAEIADLIARGAPLAQG